MTVASGSKRQTWTVIIAPMARAGLPSHLMRDFRGKWLVRCLVLLPWVAPISLGSDITVGSRVMHFVGLKNFATIVQIPAFTQALKNTLLFAGVSQILVLVLGGFLSIDPALAGFGSSAVIGVGALFIISEGLLRTGAMDRKPPRSSPSTSSESS